MKPFVIVYSEVSADGKSTHRAGASSKPMMVFEDESIRQYRHELRARCDAIMVGGNTIKIDDPQLTVRHVSGSNPLRVITSSLGDLPPRSNVLSDGRQTLVAVSAAAPKRNIDMLLRLGANVVKMGDHIVDLASLLEYLASRGVARVIVEGGATLLSSFFHANFVDQLIVQHLPVVFGGRDTPAMVGGSAISSVDKAILMRLVEVKRVGHHAVIIYDSIQRT